REWTARMARRTRSITTGTIVRKQCATVRKSDEPGINAQHGTLQNVTGLTTAAWQEFLRTTDQPLGVCCGRKSIAHHALADYRRPMEMWTANGSGCRAALRVPPSD